MKKILFLLFLLPSIIFGQYLQLPTHYDSENTAKQIIDGDLLTLLGDSTIFIVEKKPNRYIIIEDGYVESIASKVYKTFKKGNPEYSSRTNGGYVFTITVVDPKDDINILNYCIFYVDAQSQKIKEIKILRGE
jgi:hypothetical protein